MNLNLNNVENFINVKMGRSEELRQFLNYM